MALLIYKQYHRRIDVQGTPYSNAAHIQYIGMRIHALKNAETGNGLFGQLDGQFTNNINLESAMKYVRQLSFEKKTIFRSIISFTPERAEMLGLDDNKKQWEAFVKYHIHSLAVHNNIKLSDLEYIAAVHFKEGQPHLHIDFWDKNQKICVNMVDPLLCNDVREELEENAFGPVAQEILSAEEIEKGELPSSFAVDNGNKTRTELIKEAFANEQKAHYDIKNLSFDKATSLTTPEVLELLGSEDNSETVAELKDLQDKIIEQGCFLLGRLPVEMQKKVFEVTRKLVDTTPELRTHKDMYMDSERLILEMYNSTEETPGIYAIAKGMGKAQDKLEKSVANRMLKAFKNLSIEKGLISSTSADESTKQARQREAEQKQTNAAMLDILRIIKTFSQSSHNNMQTTSEKVFGCGDLSKEAIMEILYRMRDRENER